MTIVDPHPDARWVNTYSMWRDELPDWVPDRVRAATVTDPVVIGERHHVVGRAYTVLDTPVLQDFLTLDGVTVISARVDEATAQGARLTDGRMLQASMVVDARGSAAGPGIPEQTAFGVVVPGALAARVRGDAPAFVMDWRRDNGTGPGDAASFLYVVPLGDDEVLLEETCLVGCPGITLDELRRRLTRRLSSRGLELSGDETVERVRFAMRPPARVVRGAVTTGTRSPALHTATGYSVAASLRRADAIASAARRGDRRVDSPAARAVTRLRSVGAEALLSFPPAATARFFDRFFEMPEALQRAYLSSDDDLPGMSRAMMTLFSAIGTADRRVILGAVGRTVRDATIGSARSA